ncbi:hypothetical protein [uncultured Aquimarina sp.]|uniref:hypothetical protein n=1 Tax=uncultured Aquimarina sp. TaxID=575652 RepID=UPI00260F644D|nr:hypothetical protein [uncultured Aquimarina sp.]
MRKLSLIPIFIILFACSNELETFEDEDTTNVGFGIKAINTASCNIQSYTVYHSFGTSWSRTVQLPATGKFVQESHYVTTKDKFPGGRLFANTVTENINSHLQRSFNLYKTYDSNKTFNQLYSASFQKQWTPAESGSIGQGSVGNIQTQELTPEKEMWFMTMMWAPGTRPARGTKFLLSANGKKVVVIAGYETGPRSQTFLGGLTTETHAWLGTNNNSQITVSYLKNQATPIGPIACGSNPDLDTTPPTTSISASGGNTQSGDFTANFSDNDNVGVTRRFYQALEKYGDNWYANRGNGFFNDNFNILYSGYTTGAGNWNINNKHLRQSNTSSDNTKLSTFLSQNSGLPYLYEFAAKTISTSGPRKFGIHIMESDATQSQRGNSYLIWFSGEDNKVRVYETINNNLNFRAIADVSLDNKWANYKISYSPGYGVLEVFKNNRSILKWTDSSPIKNGSSISLRTNKTSMEFDDLKVYKFRVGNTKTITAGGNVTKDIRRNNGKIKSLIRDAAGNWSTAGNLDVKLEF